MRKQKIQFIVLAVILIVCIGGYFGITSYYKNKESNEKEASTIKVLEIENYKDLTKVSYNYEDATINLVKKDNKWKDESNINSEMLSTLVEIDASTKIDSPEDISQYGFAKDSDGNITGKTNSITVTDNDGKVNKIYIGSTNPYDSTKYYMMVNDDTNVYVVDSTVNDAFSKDVEELEEETTTVEETTEETTTVSETTAQETTAE